MTTTNSPMVERTLGHLRDVEAQLDTAARIALARNTLAMGRDGSDLGPQLGTVFLDLHVIVNSGATSERLDTLARTLRLVDTDIRRTLADAADRARKADASLGERALWTAVYALVLAVDSELGE